MAAPPPLWRRAFDAVEGPVGDALSAGVRSPVFADALAVTLRLNRRVRGEVERQSRRALHLVNLPAASDMRRLSTQVAELQREVHALSRRLAAEESAAPPPSPTARGGARPRARVRSARS